MLNTSFPIRKDRYGYRYVFFLGNEGGDCKYQCTFCEIGKSNAVTSEYNIKLFDSLFNDYMTKVSSLANHPLIYNRGNVTDERAFSRKTLAYILTRFNGNANITHLSLNSREKEVNQTFFDFILKLNLSYPVHFILGQESFSPKTYQIIGKNSTNEFQRLVNKIIPFNDRKYQFGIDCNLLFLPELYIGNSERNTHKKEIEKGFIEDVKKVLEYSSNQVPFTINLHPYYKVMSLPYENAVIDQFIDLLPHVLDLVAAHNQARKYKTSVFVGFRGIKTGNRFIDAKIDKWNSFFDLFNERNEV